MNGVAGRLERLAAIVGHDPGRRGIAPLVAATRGDLAAAAASIAAHPAPHVAILTGFFIPDATPPAPETDGPVGAAQLAAALARAGIAARLTTDAPCAAAVDAAARAAGVPAELPRDVLPLAAGEADVAAVLAAWNAGEAPVSHVVAIERPGPGADGVCRSMRGRDLSATTAPLHRLFGPGRVRIAVGDGGNELGMGKVHELVASRMPRGAEIGCVVAAEHLVVAGVSNWGADALVAALALLLPHRREALLAGLEPERGRAVLAATVEEGGAVDGVLGRPAFAVDGLAWEEHAAVLARLLAVLSESPPA